MADAEKARALRLERLVTMLEGRLENPPAAIEALISELQIGERQPELWEKLHASAAANGRETALADAYRRVAGGRRLKQVPLEAQAEVLTHAANFFLGILGDVTSSDNFLMASLAAVPQQPELFFRLERKFLEAPDKRRLLELYAAVAANPPKPAGELVAKAVNTIVPLTAQTPLSEELCRGLVALAPAGPSLMDVLEAHCKKTGRLSLACGLIELALEAGNMPEAAGNDLRHHLIDLYLGEANAPAKAMSHVEWLLLRDGTDTRARAAAERLRSNREVSTRASAILQEVRKSRKPAT